MSTATHTVLFTDMAGYTESVAGSDREGLRRILKEHEGIVRPIVERHGGWVVKNIGDSFLCLFPAATDALRAAQDILQIKTPGGAGLRLRLALNTGDVEIIGGDAFGDSVNLAARILGLTPAGEIWFGGGTRACMNAAEVAWEYVGRFPLKGVPGEQACFRLVPDNQVWLPTKIATAAQDGRLVRIREDKPAHLLPPDSVVLFEGYAPGSPSLAAALDALPVLDPASIFLATYRISPSEREIWTESGRGLVIGTAEAIEIAVRQNQLMGDSGHGVPADSMITVLLGRITDADLELVVGGLALPAVPLGHVVAGYHFDLNPDGRWVTHSEQSVCRIDVSRMGVRLEARTPDISVAGAMVPPGESVELQRPLTIHTPLGEISFLPLPKGYAGVLLRDTATRLGIKNGQTAEIGRKPNAPGLALPNRERQQNIRWCPGQTAKQAREQGFTLDRGLVGRQQAAVTATKEFIQLAPLHGDCPTYVLRGAQLGKVTKPVNLRLGDLIVAGTTVVALRNP